MTSPFACGHTSNSVSGRVDEEGGGVGCGEGAGGGGGGGGGARISVPLVRFVLYYNRPAFWRYAVGAAGSGHLVVHELMR